MNPALPTQTKTNADTRKNSVRVSAVNQRFLTNTILNFAGQAFLLALTFATAPYIVHRLGPELFGIIALVQTVAGFAGIVNLGIGRALTKFVSELFWERKFEEINRLFQTAWATCFVSGAIALVLLVGPKVTMARLFFRGGTEVQGVVTLAIYVAAFGLFSSMLLEAISALPGGLQRFDIVNSVNVVTGTVRNLGPVVVLALGYSIRSVLLVNLFASLLTVILFAVISRKLIPGLSLLPRFDGTAFRKLFGFSLPLFLSALSTLIVVRIDRFILAYFLPLAAVTFYTLPYTLSEKAATGVTNITSVVYPFTSELHAKGSHDKVHELYLRSTKILTLITLPFSIILMAVPGSILHFWLGPEYAAKGATALMFLGAATFLNAASAVATVSALGVGRAWMPAGFAIASSIINLILNLILIPRFGIDGAALAALLPQVLVVPVFVCVVTRMLKFSQWQLFSHGYLRPFLSASIQVTVLLIFRKYVNSMITLGLLCLASLGVYAVASLFLAVTREERTALFRIPAVRLSQS